MATYKVLQDIEAEDKLVGPLTLRQCIYAAIAAIAAYLSYVLVVSHAAFMVVFMLPFIGIGVFFAFPWNKQQSTEVWALAKVRFALKPRKRIWDQSGTKSLVAVTVPKVMVDPRQHKMTESEVRNRLHALAATVDSRGWATKNVPAGYFQNAAIVTPSDRLTDGSSMGPQLVGYKETSGDDMFDLANNPIAQQFEQKISASSQAHRQQVMQQMQNPQVAAPAGQGNWYAAPAMGSLPQTMQPATTAPAAAASTQPPVFTQVDPSAYYGIVPQTAAPIPRAAEPTSEEQAIIARNIEHDRLIHMATSMADPAPLAAQPGLQGAGQPAWGAVTTNPFTSATIPAAAMTAVPAGLNTATGAIPADGTAATGVTQLTNPATLELANNNDLDVATIAREAGRINHEGSDEVVVTLH